MGGSKGSGEFELRLFNESYVTLCLSGPSGQLFETLPIDILRSSWNGSLVVFFLIRGERRVCRGDFC